MFKSVKGSETNKQSLRTVTLVQECSPYCIIGEVAEGAPGGGGRTEDLEWRRS